MFYSISRYELASCTQKQLISFRINFFLNCFDCTTGSHIHWTVSFLSANVIPLRVEFQNLICIPIVLSYTKHLTFIHILIMQNASAKGGGGILVF